MNKNPRILVAASGTGGHLFPALFIIRALKKHSEEIKLEFVGSGRVLEEQIIGQDTIPRNTIRIVGLKGRGLKGLLHFLFLLPAALYDTLCLFFRFKPDMVIGVGGYATFLPVIFGWLLRKPTWIHEAESSPGVTTRFLAPFVGKISVAFENSSVKPVEKLVVTGQPIREDLQDFSKNSFNDLPKKLLVLGGSQGSSAIDSVIVDFHEFFTEHQIEIWHQCRSAGYEELKEKYQQYQGNWRLEPFIENMLEAYQFADIIIARSGAGTVMEIETVNIPTIFVPFPHAQGNHQLKNAMYLVEKGKALVVEEGSEFKDQLQRSLRFLFDPGAHRKMREQGIEPRSKNAADHIAKGCLELLGL